MKKYNIESLKNISKMLMDNNSKSLTTTEKIIMLQLLFDELKTIQCNPLKKINCSYANLNCVEKEESEVFCDYLNMALYFTEDKKNEKSDACPFKKLEKEVKQFLDTNIENQKFTVLAVPRNRPFVVAHDKAEAFKNSTNSKRDNEQVRKMAETFRKNNLVEDIPKVKKLGKK